MVMGLLLFTANVSGNNKVSIGDLTSNSKLHIHGDMTVSTHITKSENIKVGGNLELTASNAET